MRNSMLVLTLAAMAMAGSAACRGSEAPRMPTEHPGWRSGFAKANGLRLHYWRTRTADKPVLVMIHGITDYGLNWTSLAEKLERDYDLVMYDARGHGFSDKPQGPYDLAAHVLDLASLLDELGIGKPILVGHSMGGSIAALFAAGYPERPRALVLEDPADMLVRIQPPPPNASQGWKQAIRDDKATPKAKLIEIARTKRHPGWAAIEYERWAESKLLVEPNVVDILDNGSFGDAAATYPKIRVPVLILKADADEATKRKNLELASLLPHGRLVHVPGAGHVVRNDRPAEVERELRAFLSELDPTE